MSNEGRPIDVTRNAETPYLAVRALSVWYEDFQVLRNVSFSVQKGELFTLLGPSGSGKSTLLLCIAGFLPARTGTVFLAGQDITCLPPNNRGLGMVFQSYTLFPHKTVFQNVAYPLLLRKEPKQEIERRVFGMLKLLHLENLDRKLPEQLSGGQQQRVALARALVFNPHLLLLDEPLGAVDRQLRIELQSEIRRVQRATQSTLFYVTHDQKEAMAISDRIAILRNGEIQQIGVPRAIYENPCNPFVADFFGSSNLVRVRVLARNEHSCDVELAGCRINGAPKPSWLTKGVDQVMLMVRPEHLRISIGVSQGSDAIPCKLEELTFQGDSVVIRCILKDQTRLTVRRPTDEVLTLQSKDQAYIQVIGLKAKLFEYMKRC